MQTHKTKGYLVLIAAVVLIAMSVQIPMGYSADLTVQDKAISFMSNVIGIDMSRYTIQPTRFASDQLPPINGLPEGQLDLTLTSATGNVTMTSSFVNETLVHCALYDSNGSTPSPLLTRSMPANINIAANSLLQRYQNYTKAAYIQPMIDLLAKNSITTITSTSVIVNNLKMAVSSYGNETVVTWRYSANGVDYPNSVTLDYYNGSLKAFTDWWNLFRVGSTNVNVQEQQVISLAWEQANAITTVPISGVGNVKINLVNKPDTVQVYGAVRGNLTAYPFWYIHFPTDKNYYSVDGVEVGIWADTGQVAYCQTTGHHGFAPGDEPQPNPSGLQANNTSLQPSYIGLGIVAAAILSVVVIVIKRKRR